MNKILIVAVLISLAVPAFATDIVFLSDEGWCNIYLDGDLAADIELNSTKTTLMNVSPDSYQLKITDAFDNIWYKGILEVPDATKMIIQVEPGTFEMSSISGETDPLIEKPVVEEVKDRPGNIRVSTESYPVSEIKSLLYITSSPTSAELYINGNKAGYTPYALVNPRSGKYEIELKSKGFKGVDESVTVKKKSVSHLHIETK